MSAICSYAGTLYICVSYMYSYAGALYLGVYGSKIYQMGECVCIFVFVRLDYDRLQKIGLVLF